MKYLIVGLGNPGEQYHNTKHNTGYMILDAFVKSVNERFTIDKYAYCAQTKINGKQLTLIKPTTYMNISGKAVVYWANYLNIKIENILVIVDDLTLPFCSIRFRPNGSEGGHNGLKSISECLNSKNYPRLRFGIGNDFTKGMQIEFVLSKWTKNQINEIEKQYELTNNAIKCFIINGIEKTMNDYNKKL